MTSARVLVVDADVEVCLLIARRLTVTGYEVLTAQSADAARSLLEAAPVDCVVVAKTLPGRSTCIKNQSVESWIVGAVFRFEARFAA